MKATGSAFIDGTITALAVAYIALLRGLDILWYLAPVLIPVGIVAAILKWG